MERTVAVILGIFTYLVVAKPPPTPQRVISWSPQGDAVPGLIYGTAWKKYKTEKLVLQAFEHGFRAFDTAAHPKHYYEAGMGDALRRLLEYTERADIWLQTKFTPDACEGQEPGVHPYDPTANVSERVRQSFASSLKHLGVSFVDSYILHAPFSTRGDTLKAWQAMEKIHDEGGAKQIGVSNFNVKELRALLRQARIKPAFVQNRCLHKQVYDKEVRDLAQDQGILYQGFWLLTGNRFVSSSPVTHKIGATLNKTPQQILFRYLFQELGMMMLTGTSSATHMQQDLAIADFELPDEALTAIRGIQIPKFTASDPVTATFSNELSVPLRLFWKNEDAGTLVANAVIDVGTNTVINTFHTHTFVGKAGDSDEVVIHWRANREQGRQASVAVDRSLQGKFINVGTMVLDIFWQNTHSDEEIKQGAVGVEDGLEISTYLGHRFVAKRKDGTVVQVWVAEAKYPGVQQIKVGLAPEKEL